MANPQETASYDMGPDLYFDPAANRLFNSYGNVFDAAANAEMTKIPIAPPTGSLGGCGTPAQTRVTDPVTGKLFWVGDGVAPNLLGFSVYSRNGFARQSLVEFGVPDELGSLGYPKFLSRLPNNRLAFTTDRGYLVLLQGALLAP